MSMRAVITLFGATGDLVRGKLIGALARLYRRGVLSDRTPILFVGRRDYSLPEFIASTGYTPREGEEGFLGLWHYGRMDIERDGIEVLDALLAPLHERHDTGGNLLTYLAISPHLFARVVPLIRAPRPDAWSRVVFEKPFGHDTNSARELNRVVEARFPEESVYRIDHYLGKELVQTILALRFANPIFEHIWSAQVVDHVQITVAEEVGVGSRSGYYERSGALRDMVQNHLLQLVALTAMEPPESLDADSVREAKTSLLRAVRTPRCMDFTTGQYARGTIHGEEIPAYREEQGIAPGSTVETFLALRLTIDAPRWEGVPFYLRTGKRLSAREARVDVVLRPPEAGFLRPWVDKLSANVISIRVQPDEGVDIAFLVKEPGASMRLGEAVLDFCYPCRFGYNSQEAYEVLLEEALLGDQTLFTRWDFVEESWRITDFVEEHIQRCQVEPELYAAGSDGPTGMDRLVNEDGRKWLPVKKKS